MKGLLLCLSVYGLSQVAPWHAGKINNYILHEVTHIIQEVTNLLYR